MKSGQEYYTSTVSFEQDKIPHYMVRLTFLHDRPKWLRVYEGGTSGRTALLKDLRPFRETSGASEYYDAAENVPAKSARIYVFERASSIEQKIRHLSV